MNGKISAVINTLNEERNIGRAIKSVKWADEVLICDMHSEDKTVEIAEKLGAKVIFHKRTDYVELARNFAISKALNEWVLILDPDEEVPQTLADRLVQVASKMKEINYVRIPRKNIIFDKWMKVSGWWPDYNIRFFRKGRIKWGDKIHRPPQISGEGIDLEADEKWSIIHHNYQTVSQFIDRMDRYTSVESEQLTKEGYKFDWKDLLRKPLDEFLSRFFANKGYEDGLHGLILSLLQAFSFLIVYLKVWQLQGFQEASIDIGQIDEETKKAGGAINYWIRQADKSKNIFKGLFKKLIQ